MKSRRRFGIGIQTSLALMFVFVWMSPAVAWAGELTGRVISNNDGLTTLFNTYAFMGSMQTISKVPWVGQLLSGIISIACLIGLFATCFGIIMSMLYLSSKNLFDRVHEIKSTGKGQKFFGVQAMGSQVFNGNFGTGLDAIVGFILALFPDVKEYSYFKEGDTTYNLKENETITTFILKISLPTILTVFFFSIGFNGVLWQAYGNVVDAMGVAAETFVDTELSQYVERALHTGSSYQFAFSSTGTERGKKCQKIASELYRIAKRNTADLSSESQLAIGKSIDAWVTKNFYKGGSWVDTLGFNKEDDADFENLVIQVTPNSSDADLGDGNDSVVDICDSAHEILGVEINGDDEGYIHVILQRKVKTASPSYYTIKNEKHKSGSGSGKAVKGTIDPAISTGK